MKKALIIGPGASGIAVAKVFKENGFDFDLKSKMKRASYFKNDKHSRSYHCAPLRRGNKFHL